MRVALSANLALYFALAAVIAVAGGLAAGATGALRPLLSFRLFLAGLVLGGLLALGFGLLGLWATRGGEMAGRPRALAGLVVGVALLAVTLVQALPARSAPPIHDLTTDFDEPPAFRVAANHPDNRGRDLAYPHGGSHVAKAQRKAYPDLAPLQLALPPEAAFGLARETAEAIGWTVTWSNAELGLIEAFATSRLFRFVDDVVIRVRPSGAGARIDVRSTSRAGVSDLGANARRIRQFLAALEARAAKP